MTLHDTQRELDRWRSIREDERVKELRNLCDMQVAARKQAIFGNAVTGLDSAFALAREQGEIAGILLPFFFLDQKISDLEADVVRLQEAREE